MGAAFVFSSFLTITRIPESLSEFIIGLPIPPVGVIFCIILMFVIIGMFMEMVSALLISIPIVFPSVMALGFDPIWFVVIMVYMSELSAVTPPFGLSLFVIKGCVPEAKLTDIYYGAIPFILASFSVVVLLVYFPILVTLLPSQM